MSEHLWTQENLTSHVVGGIDGPERERLEGHLAECDECSQRYRQLQAEDALLISLFGSVRPDSTLEDRMIKHLPRLGMTRGVKAILAVAAAILLSGLGAAISALLADERLAFPGDGRVTLLFDDSDSTRAEDHTYSGVPPNQVSLSGVGKHVLGSPTGTPPKSADEIFETYHARQPRLDPFLTEDIDPVGMKLEADINFGNERLSDVTVPGINNPLEDVGNLNAPHDAPPVNLPPPAGFGSKGQGGAVDGVDFGMSGGYGFGGLSGALRGDKTILSITNGTTYFKPGDVFANMAQDPAKQPERGKSDPPGKSNSADSDVLGENAKTPPAQAAGIVPMAEPPASRKIIRSGEMEFEVDSFDNAVAHIIRLVSGTKGFVATINSDKLANGKVRGSVVVRMPPDQLDKFILDLRDQLAKTGELKSQRIGSEDVTKKYTDMESRLRAARTMEDRLLKIIKDGKGEIKDLIIAEKELGVWRTKIEEIEGELRYYNNMVSLSTLTVTLTEKSIRSASAVRESERVQMGLEVEDVEQTLRQALEAISEAKGRVTKSEMKQLPAGAFNALLHFEVAPDQAGPIRDRLKQLGNIARLEIDRVQSFEGGTKAPENTKIERGDTQFLVSIYNLANVQPRETVVLRLTSTDVAQAYLNLRNVIVKAKARINNATVEEPDREHVSAQFDFDVRRQEEPEVLKAIADAGEMLSRQVRRVPEGENMTDSKVRYRIDIVSVAGIPARETYTVAVEVSSVEDTLSVVNAEVKAGNGRVVTSSVGQARTGQVTAHYVYDVPLASASALAQKIRNAGKVRVLQVERNDQVPAGPLARARLDITLSTVDLLVPGDQGLWAQVRNGLSFSLRGLTYSVSWLIVGLLFVLPWILLIYAAIWLARRIFKKNQVGEAQA